MDSDRRNRRLVRDDHVEATAFLHEIVMTAWTLTLLNGLEPAPMRTTRHVLRVIRQRLERYDTELGAAQRALVSAASACR